MLILGLIRLDYVSHIMYSLSRSSLSLSLNVGRGTFIIIEAIQEISADILQIYTRRYSQ